MANREFRGAVVSCAIIVAACLGKSAQAAPPPDFQNQLVVSGLAEPISIAFRSDGMMIVLQKQGQMLIGDPEAVPVVLVPYMPITDIDGGGERGLIDITFDPDFESNGYFYLYYTHASSGRFRIARFNDLGLTGDLASETLIWQDNEPFSECCHYGGGLDFGPDGKLYVTTGEEFDAPQAQDLTRAGGKVIRINADGSIPPDNPFADGPGGALDEIWSYGLRNPFRARWDVPTNRFIIAEVGGNNQATAHEDIHVAAPGKNFGWPLCEGPCDDIDFPLCDCRLHDDPLWTYAHNGQGASVTGGVVYRGAQFPTPYVGAYFYGDYVRQWIRYLTFDSSGTLVTGDFEFEPSAGSVVAIETGPDGSLYYVNISSAEIRRFVFDDGNQAPVITEAMADVTDGPAPLAVNFTGDADDAEQDPLDYHWIFGDGAEADGQDVMHTYTVNGAYQAQLLVSDASHTVASAPILIEVGFPPVATITEPRDGALFRAGDSINFAGSAKDPDGRLVNEDFSWTIMFIHNEHTHPAFGPIIGPAGSFAIPVSGHDFGDATGYEIILTVTDADGLIDSTSVVVVPDKVDLSFDTDPTGLTVKVDDLPRTTPFVLDTLIGFEHTISVDDSFCDGLMEFVFDNWSDGGAASHAILVPDMDQELTATFAVGDGCTLPVLDGLVTWLRADVGVMTFGESSVSMWDDQSGLGNHLSAVGAPTVMPDALNGRSVIRFSGAGDKLERIGGLGGLPAGGADRSMFVMVKHDSTGFGGVTYGAAACNEAFGLTVAPGGELLVQGWCDDFHAPEPGTGVGWMTHSVVLESNAFTHYKNGAVINIDANTFNTTPSLFVVGAELNSNPFVAMDIAEIIIYDRALSEVERDQIEQHLQERYFGVPCAIGEDCNRNGIEDGCELGNIGKALEFDGAVDWVNIPDLSLPGDFTIEAWVRVDGVISNVDGIAGQEGPGQDINFHAGLVRLYAPGDVIIANTPTQPGVWTHYAITRLGSDLTLYYNGLPDAVGVWSGVFEPRALGRSNQGSLGGMMDEVRIWSVARTNSEILENHTRTVPTHSAGLIGYWKFDAFTIDQTVYDASGSGNHAVLGANEFSETADPARVQSSAPFDSLEDANDNGVLDECETPGDINGDGMVGPADLSLLLGNWGSYAPCPPFAPADLDGDCNIGPADLAILLANWG